MADGDDLDPLERKFLRTNLINEGEDEDLRDEGGAWHHDADIDTNDTLAPVAAEIMPGRPPAKAMTVAIQKEA